jgi:hypothetical protein
MRSPLLLAFSLALGCAASKDDSGAAAGVDGASDGADGASDGADGASDGADGASDGADGASDGADGASDGADGGGDRLNGDTPDGDVPAPTFTAANRDGSARSREDLLGQPTVMWFYPLAASAG